MAHAHDRLGAAANSAPAAPTALLNPTTSGEPYIEHRAQRTLQNALRATGLAGRWESGKNWEIWKQFAHLPSPSTSSSRRERKVKVLGPARLKPSTFSMIWFWGGMGREGGGMV